nr:MAG TPA: hypothetical protein [Caudoviricetes sp.]
MYVVENQLVAYIHVSPKWDTWMFFVASNVPYMG